MSFVLRARLAATAEGRAGAVLFGSYAQPQDFAPAQWLPRAHELIDALHEEVRRNSKEMGCLHKWRR